MLQLAWYAYLWIKKLIVTGLFSSLEKWLVGVNLEKKMYEDMSYKGGLVYFLVNKYDV